jgi:hypothetical protein
MAEDKHTGGWWRMDILKDIMKDNCRMAEDRHTEGKQRRSWTHCRSPVKVLAIQKGREERTHRRVSDRGLDMLKAREENGHIAEEKIYC